VTDLGFVAWGGGQREFEGVPRISKRAKLTILVN